MLPDLKQLRQLVRTCAQEELLPRFAHIEVMGEPTRVPSSFVRGYTSLPVRIPS